MRALLALAALLAACTTPPPQTEPTPRPTREPNTVNVSALLDLSGARTSLGESQRDAMQLWLDQTQSRAQGVVRIRVTFVDVAGSDTRLLLELRRAAVDAGADAIVVGTPTVIDETFARAAALAAVPVLLTLPATEPAAAAGGWIFCLAPTVDDVAAVLAADAAERGPFPPLVVAEDDSRAAAVEARAVRAAIADAAPGAPATPEPTPASTGGADWFRTASTAKSAILTGATSGYLELLRTMRSDVTRRLYLSYLTEARELAEVRGLAGLVTAPGSRNLALDASGAAPPERLSFIQAYTDRHGAPSTIAASAYDALALIDAAAETAPADLAPARLRERLEARTFAGMATLYRFSPSRRSGFDLDDLALLVSDARGALSLAPEPRTLPVPLASPTASPPSSP